MESGHNKRPYRDTCLHTHLNTGRTIVTWRLALYQMLTTTHLLEKKITYFHTAHNTPRVFVPTSNNSAIFSSYDLKSTFLEMEGKKPYLAGILIQSIYAGMYLFSKAALNDGMNSFVFTFYRQAAAAIFLVPVAIACERYSRLSDKQESNTKKKALYLHAIEFPKILT